MTPKAFRSFTFLCLFMTLLFGGLGAWQTHRLLWKKEILEHIHRGQDGALQTLPEDPHQWQEWHHYRVTGSWQPEKAHVVQPRVRKGQPGGHLFMAFTSSLGTLWINLGWIASPFPASFHEVQIPSSQDPLSPNEGTLCEIIIRLRHHSAPHWATPQNRPEENQWFWPDLPLWSGETSVSFYGELLAPGNGVIYPDVLMAQIPNRHLEYSITWFSFMAIVMGLWLYMYRKRLDP